MKTLATILGLALAAAAATALTPREAACTYCTSGPCITSAWCGRGCACAKRIDEPSGHCVAVQNLSQDAAQ